MKQKFTKLIRSTVRLGALLLVGLVGNSLSAQAPWCNVGGDACGWTWGTATRVDAAIDAVTINQNGSTVYSKAGDGCNKNPGNANQYTLINPGASFDLSAGGSYDVTITVAGASGGKRLGIWIDLNNDKDFNDAGEFLNPTTAMTWGASRTATINIPCNGVVAGLTRLRIRASDFGTINATSGCNATLNDGETEDYNIDLKLPTSLSANFVVPSVVYTDYTYNFVNTSQAAIYRADWDKDADNTYDASTYDYSTSWSVASTSNECLKLRATNCLGSDSITKCFQVVVPTVVPAVDFISDKTTVNLFGQAKINDLTDFGPTSWQWEIFDSTPGNIQTSTNGGLIYTNGTNANSQHPEVLFLRSGSYSVCLTATNGVGPSQRICKMGYITVLPLQDFTIGAGPQSTSEANGRIYDHAGADNDYGRNRSPNTDKFLINPCGATQIDISFTQLNFGDNDDSLFVYAGENAGAPRVAAIGGTALKGTTSPSNPYMVTVPGGAAFITFQSDGNGEDSGFIGSYKSTLGPQTPPVINFDLPSDGYFGVELDLIDKSTNLLGIPSHTWDIYEPDGPTITSSYTTKDAKHTFLTTGTSKVCLTIDGCAGSSTSCKFIDINIPSSKTELDYVANNRRPATGEQIQMTTTADKANRFLWSVFPTTATFVATDKNPVFNFTAPGEYTFTLRAWNTADSAATVNTVVKDKYVVVVDYCQPVVNILSSDVAISNFKITKSGTTLLNRPSSVGVNGYNDFSSSSFIEGTFGATYDYEIERASAVDPANTKVWVDFNLDGKFTATELVQTFPASNNTKLTGSFTVPNIAQSFIGNGRIRVSMAYGGTSNTACGPLVAGEVEDYGIRLNNDMMPPTIALNGADTVYVERASVPNYVDAGAVATDPTEGDISANIVTTTDMDQTTAGIYSYQYCITDASGNGPVCVTRTVYVVLDRTAPVLTLSGSNPMTIEVDDPFVDPGATANDNVDGVLTPSITVTGSVDNTVIGTYVLTYKVSDVQGNTVSLTRTVNVVDTKVPVITAIGSENIQINTIWADQTVVSDNYYDGIRATKVPLVATPGPNGLPNTTVRASYPVTYTATDGSGNSATPVIRNYVVDDFIPPVIDLKTLDTVYHRVNTQYFSTNPQVTDNFYDNSNVSLTHVNPNAVDAYTLGTYTEMFVAVDGSRNRDTATRYVKVIDDVKPTIFAPAINGCAGYDIDNMAGLQLSDNYDAPSALLPRVQFIQNDVNVHLPGLYTMTYEVSDLSGNVSSPFTRTVSITYCLPGSVSVKTVKLDDVTKIYPNPSSGKINVKVSGISNQEVVVTVYNTVGTQVAEARDAQGNEISVDLNNHATGVYMVKVSTGGQSITKKVTLTK